MLRISEAARRVGISSSALRAWEVLGLVTPRRTESRYRMYTEADVRLLQRAMFLRRARGLNPAAIVHVLKRQGIVSALAERAMLPGQRFRRLRARRGLSLAQVARATGVSIGFLSALGSVLVTDQRSTDETAALFLTGAAMFDRLPDAAKRDLRRHFPENVPALHPEADPSQHLAILMRPSADANLPERVQ